MKKVYLLMRINRFDKRIIKAFADVNKAIEERNAQQKIYPMGNYIIEDIELCE